MIRAAFITLAALLFADTAVACSCPFIEPAGFVHANLTRLPANARGALFLTPQGDPPANVNEKDFVITSNKHKGQLNVTLTYPDFRIHAQQLVRVGPTEGFRPGARYIIRYVGKSGQWHYPTSVAFIVDANKIDVKSLSYQLKLDGPPNRRLLAMGDGGGSCASNQPVITQKFSYVVPEALRPYQQAMTYFSEVGAKGKFRHRIFQPALCSSPTFGATAYGNEQDLIQVDCSAPGDLTAVRGQVAFLEIEDKLQATAPLRINLRRAEGQACYGMGMLKEALARGDHQQALDLVCQLPREATYDGAFDPHAPLRKIPVSAPPSSEALAQLARHATEEQRLCIVKIGREL
ncbi:MULTISPECIES: hypothetical protein [unclassified Duganella]|uniref:hypothetical protein n=1 Tax=unclassified Duganella TaxID=2636909 RepID=UPI0008818917|nr:MULTISPECIES: hypothetical protein [unclassified Duganella]SDF69444.1 hypothetical protein SAMN05216320_1011000 [Duganella sp. OV458]SDI59857.1 hypothetical protein SAMN05428973_101415 [Duganella sp. OV510]